MSPDASQLVEQAQATYGRLREHKRAANFHRHRAADARTELEEIQRRLAAAGITLTLKEADGPSWPLERSAAS